MKQPRQIAQKQLVISGVTFTTKPIHENQFAGTALVFHNKYMAHKALMVLKVNSYWLRHARGSKTWELPYFD